MCKTFGKTCLELMIIILNIVKSRQDFNEILDFLAKFLILNRLRADEYHHSKILHHRYIAK